MKIENAMAQSLFIILSIVFINEAIKFHEIHGGIILILTLILTWLGLTIVLKIFS